MDHSRTLWMGNLDPGTDHNYIREIFNQLSKIKNIMIIIIDIKILNIRTLFKEEKKIGSAFVEFETPEIAQKVLREYNGKTINGLLLKLNWTKLNTKNYNGKNNIIYNNESSKENKNNVYTVSIFYLFFPNKYINMEIIYIIIIYIY